MIVPSLSSKPRYEGRDSQCIQGIELVICYV